MINSFYIKNFRLFDELKITGINRVNLLVGKNNSGKTALLEALYAFLSDASKPALFELLGKREEDWALEDAEIVAEDVIRHLFKGHCLPEVGDEGITLSELTKSGNPSKKNLINIKTSFEINEFDDGELRSFFSEKEGIDDISSLVLLVVKNSKTIDSIDLQEDFTRRSRMHQRMYLRRMRLRKKNIQFVTTEFADNNKVSTLWDTVSLTGYEEDIINGLKIIEPKIEGVTFVSSETSRGRTPLIKLKGEKERLALKSLGDGVFRLFFIILSLVNAKGSYLIIDEFENGLHWSVQEKIWDVVFRLSELLKVQVFVTSHSRDCVAAFEKVWLKNEKLGSFYRLSGSESKHSVTSYDLETLSDSMEMEVEVR